MTGIKSNSLLSRYQVYKMKNEDESLPQFFSNDLSENDLKAMEKFYRGKIPHNPISMQEHDKVVWFLLWINKIQLKFCSYDVFLVNQDIEEILKKILLVVIIFTSKRLEKRVRFSLVKHLGSLNSIVNFIYFLGDVVQNLPKTWDEIVHEKEEAWCKSAEMSYS